MNVAQILRELVQIPSVSQISNRPLIEWIRHFLEPRGWSIRTLSYRDEDGIEKVNLLACSEPMRSQTINAELALVCHTDTVPSSSDWKNATELIEHEGFLHGLGACDVKGFLACILAAVDEIDLQNLQRPLCLVFTSDEEIGCRGARFLFDRNALRARYAIVGEPTSLIPAHAGKGYGLAEVCVRGQEAHSAFPQAGRSAILAAASLLREIESLAEELAYERHDAFSPAWTTVNVGTIQGGAAKNIVPGRCSFLVEWRPIPTQDVDRVSLRLRELAAGASRNGITVEVQVLRNDSGFATSLNSPVLRAVQREEHAPPQAVSFGTEAPWLTRMGAEAIVVGPGSMLTAHSMRECVPESELEECVAMLRAAIERLCIEQRA